MLNLKKTLLVGLHAAALVAGVGSLTGCTYDYHYDPTYQKRLYQAVWEQKFGEIDENQDWSMAQSATANMAINGMDALSAYKLKLYTDNPLASSKAKLVASVSVTTDEFGTAAVSLPVDIQKGQTVFYACYEDNAYRRNVKAVALIDGKIEAKFGTPVTRASVNSDAVQIPTVESPAEEVNTKYAQAVEVNAENSVANWSEGAGYASVLKIGAGKTWNGSINVSASELELGRTIYVDGTWILNGEARLGGTGLIVVRNGGKIVIPEGSSLVTANAGRLVVLPGAAVEGDGVVEFANGSGASFQYNAGNMDIGTLNINFGLFYNYGEIHTKLLYGPSTLGTYINQGKTFVVESPYGSNTANLRIKNACQLEVEKDLCCRDLTMGPSAYTHVGKTLRMSGSEDATVSAPEALLAAGAFLDVNGGVALNNASIVGPTEGWAVCQFGKIGDPDNLCATNYTTSWNTGTEQIVEGLVINNLYISIDETETIDNLYTLTPYGKFVMCMMNGRIYDAVYGGNESNGWAQITVANYRENAKAGNGNAVIVSKGQANVIIPEGCGVAYDPEPGKEEEEDAQVFIFACEDLGSVDDYDFNDLVFAVSHVAGQTEAKLTALAAGGTLAANIMYDGQNLGEIHSLLGVEETTEMINTVEITNTAKPVVFTVPADWTLAVNYSKFQIMVEKNGVATYVEAPQQGKAPQMIIVPSEWQWPIERISITDAYPGFELWTKDATISNWNSKCVEENVVKR